MSSEEANGAVGKSISFRPYSLYTDAAAYGGAQVPRQTVSSVICEALEEFLDRKGFRVAGREGLTELVALANQMGLAEALRRLRASEAKVRQAHSGLKRKRK